MIVKNLYGLVYVKEMIEKFHFRKAYCQLQIVYQWWMKIAVNILFPFRKLVPVQSVKAILNMEAMRRNKY